MGFLSNILENPALIGMAMAGMSRDPEAPMNAVRTYSAMDEMKRAKQEQAYKMLERERMEKQRMDNLAMLQAFQNQEAQKQGMLSQALGARAKMFGIPSQVTQFTPDQQAGTAVDYETGQAYTPQQAPNPARSQALQDVYAKFAELKNTPRMDISKYSNASPEVALAIAKSSLENQPMKDLMGIVEKDREKEESREFDLKKLETEYGYKKEIEGMKEGNKGVKYSDIPSDERSLAMDNGYNLQNPEGQESYRQWRATPQGKAAWENLLRKRATAVHVTTPKSADEIEGIRLSNEEKKRRLSNPMEKMHPVDRIKYNKALTQLNRLNDMEYDPIKGLTIEGDPKLKAKHESEKAQYTKIVEELENKYLSGQPAPAATPTAQKHPLAGSKPGRYKVNGKIIRWDGSKEI